MTGDKKIPQTEIEFVHSMINNGPMFSEEKAEPKKTAGLGGAGTPPPEEEKSFFQKYVSLYINSKF